MKISITVHSPDIVKAAQTVAEALNSLPQHAHPAPIKRGETPEAPEAPMTLERLAMAATKLVDAGRGEELRALLKNKYGVDAMTKLGQSAYGTFASDLKAMGARI